MEELIELLRDAITNRRQVIATYDGHVRHLCPHLIGRKNRTWNGLFYQFGGTSSSGPVAPGSPGNWKCLELSRLQNVTSQDGEWHTAENYDPQRQTCVDFIDTQVS